MKLYYEWGTRQLNKFGEELCGDSIAVSRHPDYVTLALSDGLGSGVKANILATLTTQIAMHMLDNDLPLDEVVQTLSETLPVDRIRKLAYSTFAIAQFFSQGTATIAEFDTPSTIFLRGRKIQPIVYEERSIDGKRVHESVLEFKSGDWIIFVSDGVLNAGIGGVYPLGWGWEQAARFLEKQAHQDLSAFDRRRDEETIVQFLKQSGKLVVCGGTTAKIIARHLGQPLEVDLTTITDDVPPMAQIDGIDLVSEGILTLTKTSELLRSGVEKKAIRFQTDGAASLLRLMLGVDYIHFIVGQAVNPAHQNPELPHQLGIRQKVVREIGEELKARGKEVIIEMV
jgi:hypothetical protein